MAEIGYNRVLYKSDGPLKFAVLEVTKASTNDTIELSGLFSRLYESMFFMIDGPTVMKPLAEGTVITFDVSGLTLKSGWLAVLGAEA